MTHDGFFAIDIPSYPEAISNFPSPVVKFLTESADEYGIDPSTIDLLAIVWGIDRADPDELDDDRMLVSALISGDVDVYGTQTALDDRRVETVGHYRDRTVYARSNRFDQSRSTAFAVGPRTFVGASVDASSEPSDGPITRTATRFGPTLGSPDEDDTVSNHRSSRDNIPTDQPPATEEDLPLTPTVPESADNTPADVGAYDAVKLHLDALAGIENSYPPEPLGDLVPNPDSPIVGGMSIDGDDLRNLLFHGDPSNDVAVVVDDLLAGLRGIAASVDFESDSDRPTTVTVRFRYDDPESTDPSNIESLLVALREQNHFAAALDHVAVRYEVDEGTLRIRIDADLRAAFRAFDDEVEENQPSPVPQVSLTFEVGDDGRVTIIHEGGDFADQLLVRCTVNEEQRTETWTSSDGVAAGDAFTTSAAPDTGTKIHVIWESKDGSSAAVIGMYSVPQ